MSQSLSIQGLFAGAEGACGDAVYCEVSKRENYSIAPYSIKTLKSIKTFSLIPANCQQRVMGDWINAVFIW